MAPQTLNVMQFNIEYGGTGVDFCDGGQSDPGRRS